MRQNKGTTSPSNNRTPHKQTSSLANRITPRQPTLATRIDSPNDPKATSALRN
ncbi:hypothetical protein PTTG_28958 [Puccinia triticina 1-1 BBBD Race 1]|uniref:Uncharacterized protein n=1 Tax=Puccinia triticina (isolate 1-1 / race 1 (BBBD)) TaxID=630390 RepID=A0A180G7L7_PUCT1|nr:hypothetical protein PTTG_28958 [Puccinia triticina 1-1 BBBD Race 1]